MFDCAGFESLECKVNLLMAPWDLSRTLELSLKVSLRI
jgi:hypothetical protein